VYGLRELQRDFGTALLNGMDPALAGRLVDRGLSGARRFEVYRNNVRLGFAAAMEVTFPVLRRLVGETYFSQLARNYQLAYPSGSGNLFYVGLSLPDYLERQYAGGKYDYFADVARLEWLCQEALWAADAAPLDISRLAEFSPARPQSLRLVLHPSVRLMQSAYPVLRIWQENQPDSAADKAIDLHGGGERILLRRSDAGLELHRLSAGEFTLLNALFGGDSLERALEVALCVEPDLPFAQRLPYWTGRGVLSDFSFD